MKADDTPSQAFTRDSRGRPVFTADQWLAWGRRIRELEEPWKHPPQCSCLKCRPTKEGKRK